LVSLFKQKRLQVLILAVGLGLIAAEASLLVNFTLPFFAVLLSALLVLFCLFRFYSLYKK
jgi:hypothetical protein